MDEWPPPWIAMPEMQPYDPATQGTADWYINQNWLPFWQQLTPEQKAKYFDRWEASPLWRRAIAYLYDGDNNIDWEEEGRIEAERRAANVDNVPPRPWWRYRRRMSKADLQKRVESIIAAQSGSDFESTEPVGAILSGRKTDNLPQPIGDPPDVVAFDVRVTLEDLLALQVRRLRTPAMQADPRRRLMIAALIGVALALLALAGGVLIWWAAYPRALSVGLLLHSLVLEKPGT